ncbi:MAG: phage minor capsid protein [Acutalibacteraceae bacterium]|nr:phage minor capsid protein [Acutalibacteraceae bacterium]
MAKLTYEQALAKLYTKAEAQLIKIIKQKTSHGNATAYERSLLSQVDEQIKALQKSSDEMVQKLVKSNYRIGLDKLMQDIAVDKNAPSSYNLMSGLNTNQINIIVDNITSQLNQAIATVGRRCDDYVRQAVLSATAKKLTTGQTVREMQKELETNLTNNNITSIKYANGTEHNIKDYATMVARTTTAETQNTAQLVQGNAWGYDLVRMTSHYPTCEVCAMYQGRVYATTKEAANGKYKDKNGNPLLFPYIYDTVFVDGYDTVHPNCRHRFAIFPANAYTLDELAEFSRKSMQPFEDTRSDKERKAYAAEQAVKRKRNASRRQYEDVKRYLPDQAPKTFAGWQRMKSANSQRYLDLMEDYRTLRKSVANSDKSGIINFKDNNPYYKEITQKNINNIPKLNIFDSDKLNLKYQQANKDLLIEAKKQKLGLEISAVYNQDMQQIGGYTIGGIGNVKIKNPDVPYHAFHNHPSGETFSIVDILKFCNRDKMLSITATGNNANCYNFSVTDKSDKKAYNLFLNEKLKQPLFGDYTYQTLSELNIEGLSTDMKAELKVIITRFTEECINAGSKYGFKYTFTRLVE